MTTRKQYGEAFRRDALHMLETSGKSVAQVERELGLSAGLLHKWKRRYQCNDETDALEPSSEAQLQAEIRRLQRELSVIQQERDILKKTVGIFSKDPRR